MNIVILSGSPRQGSLTHRVALHLNQRLQEITEHNIQLVSLQDIELPPIQAVWSSVEKAPEQFRSLAETMFSADAFILVSPEYNGSYSAALKNLIDFFPKQHRKPFGVVTASPGALGGIRAAQQMQLLVAALFGILSPYMLVVPTVDKKFDADGNLIEPSFQNSVHQFTTEFLWLAQGLVVKEEALA
jgi:NAD(P)H-dependent FMN reductase